MAERRHGGSGGQALFSSVLREARTSAGLTLDELANLVNVSRSFVSLVERGLRQPTAELVVRFAETLHLDPRSALRSYAREQLPEGLRYLVSDRRLKVDGAPDTVRAKLHAATRELMLQHQEYTTDRLRLERRVSWDGTLHSTRLTEGVRPNPLGLPVWEISFQTRVFGQSGSTRRLRFPVFEVLERPIGLKYDLVTEDEGATRTYRIRFPEGWRRGARDDSFSFRMETWQPNAYVFTKTEERERLKGLALRNEPQGSAVFHPTTAIGRLELGFEFPRPYVPSRWGPAWVWHGFRPYESVPRNLAAEGTSRSISLRTHGGRAELTVEEPLVGYSYAVLWTPADDEICDHYRTQSTAPSD